MKESHEELVGASEADGGGGSTTLSQDSDAPVVSFMGEHTWDRMRIGDELEPLMWFDRFTIYRLLGPDRSYLAAYRQWREEAGKSAKPKTIPHSWDLNVRKWRWLDRVPSWDEHLIRDRMERQESNRAEMLRRHAMLGRAMQAIASQKLQALTKNPDTLPPAQARLMALTGSKMELRAMGMPEHLAAVALMSTEELLEQYAELLSSFEDDSGDRGDLDAAWGADSAAKNSE